MNAECIFCKIIRGEAPAKIVYQDECVTSFWDINRSASVHLLVVPNLHLDSLNEMPEDMGPVLSHMFFIARQLAHQYNIAEGYRLVINTGAEGGQSVFHLHLHLIGGKRLGPIE